MEDRLDGSFWLVLAQVKETEPELEIDEVAEALALEALGTDGGLEGDGAAGKDAMMAADVAKLNGERFSGLVEFGKGDAERINLEFEANAIEFRSELFPGFGWRFPGKPGGG